MLDVRQVDGALVGYPGVVIDVLTTEATFDLVKTALLKKTPFSIVRMSDGEAEILNYCQRHPPDHLMTCWVTPQDPTWNIRYGVDGITCGEIEPRLRRAALNCTYFAADGWMPRCGFFIKHFPLRLPLVNVGFPHYLTTVMKQELMDIAQQVLVVNRDPAVAKAIGDPTFTKAHVEWVSLANWRESEQVIEQANRTNCSLVLVSAGPANKYIVPEIAKSGKTVLDIGKGALTWWQRVPWEDKV